MYVFGCRIFISKNQVFLIKIKMFLLFFTLYLKCIMMPKKEKKEENVFSSNNKILLNKYKVKHKRHQKQKI